MATWTGTTGNDFYNYTGSESLYAYARGGNDTVYGNTNNDYLFGEDGDDYLNGRNGNDNLSGGNGNDMLDGGLGNDVLVGGLGNDMMYGGAGNDIYNVDSNFDYVYEYSNSGTDTVYSTVNYIMGNNIENLVLTGSAYSATGSALNNSIYGNFTDNYLFGNLGSDYLVGEAGNDTLVGGWGNDLLSGGNGNDRLNGNNVGSLDGAQFDFLGGGAGSDYFILGDSFSVYYQDVGYAIITDWDASADYIEVKGTSSQYSLGFTTNLAGSFANDTTIHFNGEIIGVVQDTTNVNIGQDFIFV